MVKKSLSERFSSFFRVNKSFTMDDEQTDANGDNAEEGDKLVETLDEVVIDNKDVPEEKEAVSETTETVEEKVDDKSEKKEKSASRFMVMMTRLFKGRDIVADKAEEKPISMSDIEKGEEKDTEKPAIIDELEPEDKPEKEEANKEVEQKPTPNTSF